MANPADEKIVYPFTAFNFAVEIRVPGTSDLLCSAAFSECDGLEMTMDVKTIREGGNNTSQIRLTGPVNYGQVTLKRGMTANFDLWDWFDKLQKPGQGSIRAEASVVVFEENSRAQKERVRFILRRCLPVKLKAPGLNAKDGMVAIEELQLSYESMSLQRPS